ncbi:MAG: tryptophan synthase beta chain, partial [Spirochaetes bacterium]
HGMSPLVSLAAKEGLLAPAAVAQLECFAAAVTFAKTEGIVVAPETSHAIAQVIREANRAKEEGKEKVILFGLSGHGFLDLQGYSDYFSGMLQDHELSRTEIDEAIAGLKDAPRLP